MIEVSPFRSEELHLLPSLVFWESDDLHCGLGDGLPGWQLRLQWFDFGISLTVARF